LLPLAIFGFALTRTGRQRVARRARIRRGRLLFHAALDAAYFVSSPACVGRIFRGYALEAQSATVADLRRFHGETASATEIFPGTK